jgi:hypothetical protein
MNTVPLPELVVLLEKELFRLHYNSRTIKYYRMIWKHIIAFCESAGVDHFTEDLESCCTVTAARQFFRTTNTIAGRENTPR